MILQTGRRKSQRNSRPRRRQIMDNQNLVQKGQLPHQECSRRKNRLRKSQKLRRDTNRQQNGVCKRLIILKQGLQFELLPQIAEIASSLPMSNVWPERGVSCLKRLKTRLRSRIKVDMLNTLMLISINGPDLYSPECNELIKSAAPLWNKKKNRRKLPPKVPVETESTAFVAVPYSVDSACQTEACETETVTVEQSISDESHVILALGLSQEDSECADSDLYSDPEFDYHQFQNRTYKYQQR